MRARSTLRTLSVVTLVAAAGAALLVRRRCVVVTVDGASMTPALTDGDRLLVRRVPPAAVRAGHLVVARRPDSGKWRHGPRGLLVKRAVALPGDPVPKDSGPALRDLPEERVPENRLVLLGDNPADSLDSRYCGYFRADQILGVVVHRLPARTPGRARTQGDLTPWPI